jgi:membrane protein implicated in regulation of membrane protease activity
MPSTTPEPLSPSARSAALLVARLIFYNGLLTGVGLIALAIGVFFFQVGAVSNPSERWQASGVLIVLALLAFGFVAFARLRVKRLKRLKSGNA